MQNAAGEHEVSCVTASCMTALPLLCCRAGKSETIMQETKIRGLLNTCPTLASSTTQKWQCSHTACSYTAQDCLQVLITVLAECMYAGCTDLKANRADSLSLRHPMGAHVMGKAVAATK